MEFSRRAPAVPLRPREHNVDDITEPRPSAYDVAAVPRPVSSSIAIVLILALAASIAATGVVAEQERSRAERAAKAERALAQTTLRVEGAMRDVVTNAEDTVDLVVRGSDERVVERLPAPAGSTSMGFVTAGDERLVLAAGSLPRELVASPDLLTVTGRARDDGAVLVTPPVAAGDDVVVGVVVPLYRGAGGALARSTDVESTAVRRSATAGWVVAVVDTRALLTTSEAGPDVSIVDGQTVLAGPPLDSARDVSLATEVPGRTWSVVLRTASTPSLPGRAPWLLLGGIAVAVVTLVASAAAARRRARAAADAAAFRRQAEIIRRFAPVVQQSLDLADVLPALAIQLVDDLDLDGLSLEAIGSGGDEIALFTLGDPMGATDDDDDVAAAQVRVPENLRAGERLTLSLQRGGRAIATLRLRAARDLDRTELESIQVACELTTAAIINARSFEQQQEAVDRLRAVDELKTVFLATASHELRTPVTAITSFSVMLDERWDQISDDDRRLFASRLAHNCRVLQAMVQDLLDFSQLERGRLVVTMDTFDIDEFVAALVDRTRTFWPTHRLELDIVASAPVEADRTGLDRVLTNLIGNAVKFSPAGSTVTTTVSVEDGHAVITVDDEGPGVPLADRDKVFTSFFRGSGAEVVRTRGTGVGLSVARQYVDQMGGSIGVGDSPSGGARFTVRLRRAAVDHRALEPTEARRTDGSGS
jgi:signal transduction histidine kinase